MGTERDFLDLINHKGLPLFNPLVGDSHVNNRQEHDNRGNKNSQIKKWNERAKQFYNAIMRLIILWAAKTDTPLFDFKDEVYKYKNCEPFDNIIKSVNTAIKTMKKGKH